MRVANRKALGFPFRPKAKSRAEAPGVGITVTEFEEKKEMFEIEEIRRGN